MCEMLYNVFVFRYLLPLYIVKYPKDKLDIQQHFYEPLNFHSHISLYVKCITVGGKGLGCRTVAQLSRI